MSIDNLKSLHHWINVEPHGDGSPLCAGCNTQGITDQGHHDDAGVCHQSQSPTLISLAARLPLLVLVLPWLH
jgi:hypothetical protein